MNLRAILLLTMMFTLVVTDEVRADTKKPSPIGLSILGALAFPQDDFADGKFFDKEKDGAATRGYGVGIEFAQPLQGENMQAFAAAYFIRNPMDLGEYEESGEDDYVIYNVTFESGAWTNLSVMGGLRITQLGGVEGLYLQGAAGINRVSMDDFEASIHVEDLYGYYENIDEEIVYSASSENVFAFSIGAGIKVGAFDIGVRYFNLGEPNLRLKAKSTTGETDSENKKIEIPVFAVVAGVSF